MKKIISFLVIIAMMFSSGCSHTPEALGLFGFTESMAEGINCVVLIIDKSKFAPCYDYEMLLGDDITKYYSQKKDKVTVICPDGSGNPSSKTFVFEGTNKKVDQNTMKRVVKKEGAKVFAYIEEVKPVEAELSLIPALSLAANELASDEAAIKRVYLVTGGLTTVAPVDMTSCTNMDTESTINSLLANDMLPDFKGASIDVYGLGYVAPGKEQKSLSNPEKKNLTTFYEGLLMASKADCRIHTNTPDSDIVNDQTNALPYVTPVATLMLDNHVVERSDKSAIHETEDDFAENTIDLSKEMVKLSPETLNYKPGSDQFLLSKEEVAQKLEPIKDWYDNNPGLLYIFSGTASFGTEQELRELSKKRGNAVKEILVSLGVNADDILVVPMGYLGNPYKENDVINGVCDEKAAMQNRVTYIMSPSTPQLADFKGLL